jgi:hypothetical protein
MMKRRRRGIKRERLDRPQEYEDDAQKLTNLELAGNLVVRIRKRLAIVERAPKKLEGEPTGCLTSVADRFHASASKRFRRPFVRLTKKTHSNTSGGWADRARQREIGGALVELPIALISTRQADRRVRVVSMIYVTS